MRTAEIVAEAAEAIHFALLKGLIHRDLKPSNIMFGRDGRARIVDFGLALPEDQQRDRAGEFAGTLPYMSPEQVRRETHLLDGRTDIWSLGIILYQMLTGRRPFSGNQQQMSAEILKRDPKPPRQVVQDVSKDLEEVCLKCLAKSATGRWATAQDISDALKSWLKTRRCAATSLAAPQPPTLQSAQPRRWMPVTVAVLCASALLGWVVLKLITHPDSSIAGITTPSSRERPDFSKSVAELTPAPPLDDSPLKVWTHLISEQRKPEEYLSSMDKAFYSYNLERDRKVVRLQSNHPSLVKLGETKAKHFRLRATFVETAGADNASGFFWGTQVVRRPRQESDPPGKYQVKVCSFYQISFRARSQPDKPVA